MVLDLCCVRFKVMLKERKWFEMGCGGCMDYIATVGISGNTV